MTDSPSSRSRGAQPGNKNALKHGFYTRRLPGLKNVALDQLDTEFPGLEEEIFVLRAYIRRMLQCSGGTTDFHEFMFLFRTLCMGLSTLARLTREHRAMSAQPVDTLASLRQARTGVSDIKPPEGCFNNFMEEFTELFPDYNIKDYYEEVEGCIPGDTFDGDEDQPTPVGDYDGIPFDPFDYESLSKEPPPTPAPVESAAPEPDGPLPTAAPQPPIPVEFAFPESDWASPSSNEDSLPGLENPFPEPITGESPYKPFIPSPDLLLRVKLNACLKRPGKPNVMARRLIDQLPKFIPRPDPPPKDSE